MALTQVAGGMIASSQTITNPTLTTPIVSTTLGVGGATPAASGSGITFPATQSASSDANTLDDYEEGTWTPTYIGSTSGTASMTAQAGYYIKVGQLVTVWGLLRGGKNTVSGVVRISGLPFVALSATGLDYGQQNAGGASWGWAADRPVTVQAVNGAAYLGMWDSSTNDITDADMSTSSATNAFGFQISYRSAS